MKGGNVVCTQAVSEVWLSNNGEYRPSSVIRYKKRKRLAERRLGRHRPFLAHSLDLHSHDGP